MFWDLWTDPTLALLSLLLQKFIWNSSFCDMYSDIYPPEKNKVNTAQLVYIKTGFEIGILLEKKLSWAYMLIE